MPKVYIIIAIALYAYFLYRRKFKYFVIINEKSLKRGKKQPGKSLPAFPNGWFALLKTKELAIGETKYVEAHGESIALFRGNNGKVYGVHAYCAHLGANLGIEGKVIHDSCIQCPFHAWTFDGETGNCVIGKDLKQKEGIRYEYTFSSDEATKDKCDFKAGKKEKIQIRKYPTDEKCGFIYVYFDNSEEYKRTKEIPYEPLDVSEYQKKLSNCGMAVNTIECHMSEIYENTADMAHLTYIHGQLYTSFVKNFWKNVSFVNGDDPEIEEKLKHENPEYDAHRKKVIKFITEKNKKYTGIYSMDAKVAFGNSKNEYHLFSATGLQVGGGLSYLFVVGKGYELFWTAFIEPKERFKCLLKQEFYSSKWMPYLMSAFFVYSEQQQILNDGIIFDNKKFPFKPYLSEKSDADNLMATWFKYYSQFYDGCNEYEKEKEKENEQW